MAHIGSQDAFGSDVEAKIQIFKKYWKTEGKTFIFESKIAPKCRKMTPKSFQEPSWPLLDRSCGILGRSWRLFGRSWGDLGRRPKISVDFRGADAKISVDFRGAGGRRAQFLLPSTLLSKLYSVFAFAKSDLQQVSEYDLQHAARCCAGGGGSRTRCARCRPPPPTRVLLTLCDEVGGMRRLR